MESKIVNSIEDINILDRNDWFYISKYYRLSETFIETHSRQFYWDIICKYQKLSETFIEKHIDIIDWDEISHSQKLSEEFILKHKDKLNWDVIIEHQILSESFMEKHYFDNDWGDSVYWHCASMYQNLSEEFIEKHQDRVYWVPITLYQNLSESFIEKFYHTKIDKESLFLIHKLSEEFIEKHLYDVIRYPNFFKGQTLSEEFIEMHKDDLFDNKRNWYLYNISHRVMTYEERLADMSDYANKYNLEFDGKYLYAYRNHDSFCRGMWKNYLSYEVGKYYRDWHLDMNIDEANSFGLGIWSEGNTKVKVDIDDWGLHLKRDDSKCRVWGFTVLEQN